jgi:hypothetical protein
LACGIKAGQALKVVKAFKDICANDGTGVSQIDALPLGMQVTVYIITIIVTTSLNNENTEDFPHIGLLDI